MERTANAGSFKGRMNWIEMRLHGHARSRGEKDADLIVRAGTAHLERARTHARACASGGGLGDVLAPSGLFCTLVYHSRSYSAVRIPSAP